MNRISCASSSLQHPVAAVASPAIQSPFQSMLSDSMRNQPAHRIEMKPALGNLLHFVSRLFARVCAWIQTRFAQTANRRLRVAETVSLGEKRFVALITVEGREFLIGGGATGVSLLAQLGSPEPHDLGLANGSPE